MSFIQQVLDKSCFVRCIWDDGTEQDISKSDFKLFIREGLVVIEDDSPFRGEVDYTKVTNPVSASALILHDAIRVYADTNPCENRFDPTTITGWNPNNPDMILQPVGDGSANLIWRQSA